MIRVRCPNCGWVIEVSKPGWHLCPTVEGGCEGLVWVDKRPANVEFHLRPFVLESDIPIPLEDGPSDFDYLLLYTRFDDSVGKIHPR